jgi:hypothetical protein
MVSRGPAGGGVARRTGPPTRSGTCKKSLLGLVAGARLFADGGGNVNTEVLTSESSTTGVLGTVLFRRFVMVPGFVVGLTGNVENGPSVMDRLLGGRPRNLPAEVLLLLGHADDTAGP